MVDDLSVGRSVGRIRQAGPLQLQLARQKIVASIVLSSPAHSIRWSTNRSLSLSFSSYYIIIILGDKKGSPGSKGRVSSAVKALPKFETRSPGGWIGVAAVVAFPFPPPLFPSPREISRVERRRNRDRRIFFFFFFFLSLERVSLTRLIQ